MSNEKKIAELEALIENLVQENSKLTVKTVKLFGALQSAVSQGSSSWDSQLIEKARNALKEMPENQSGGTEQVAKEPLSDEQISLGLHNLDEGDWNSIGYQKSWQRGFVMGARFAEEEHGIKRIY